jgi:hypothetical protein
MSKDENVIILNGAVQTNLSLEKWTNDFIEWIESRNECYGGGINLYDDKEDNICQKN